MPSYRLPTALNRVLTSLQQISSNAEMGFKNLQLRNSTSGGFRKFGLHCETPDIVMEKLAIIVLLLDKPEPKSNSQIQI